MAGTLNGRTITRKAAIGFLDIGAQSKKVSIKFEPALFAEISAKAAHEQRPFAFIVRQLVREALAVNGA